MNDNKEKTEGMMLEEQLVWKFPHIGKDAPEQVEAAAEFCEDYKAFLDEGKTDCNYLRPASGVRGPAD